MFTFTPRRLPAFFVSLFCLYATTLFSDENWNQILAQMEEKMNAQTISYIRCNVSSKSKNYLEIAQQKNDDGTVVRVEEVLDEKSKGKKKREDLAPLDSIHKTYYTSNGETILLVTKKKIEGVLWLGGKVTPLHVPNNPETQGQETELNGVPCWEIRQNIKTTKGTQVFKYIIDKEKLLLLVFSTFKEDGTLSRKMTYSDFNLAPQFAEGTFAVPSEAKLTRANSAKETMLAMNEIMRDRGQEMAEEALKASSSTPSHTPTKAKQNSTRHLIFGAVGLAVLCFAAVFLLKRKR